MPPHTEGYTADVDLYAGIAPGIDWGFPRGILIGMSFLVKLLSVISIGALAVQTAKRVESES